MNVFYTKTAIRLQTLRTGARGGCFAKQFILRMYLRSHSTLRPTLTRHRRFKQESDIRSSCGDFAYTPASCPILRFGCSSVSGKSNWALFCVIHLPLKYPKFVGTLTLGQDLEKRLVYLAQTACVGNCKLHHALHFSGSCSGALEILQSGVRLEAITLESGLIKLSVPPAGTVLLDPSVPWIVLPRLLVSEFCE